MTDPTKCTPDEALKSSGLEDSKIEKPQGSTDAMAPRSGELPSEILQNIFENLEVKDIKSSRLTCRDWASAAQRPLFREFVFRPERRDFERFQTLASKGLLSGTNAVVFDIGDLRYILVMHNMRQVFERDCGHRVPPGGLMDDEDEDEDGESDEYEDEDGESDEHEDEDGESDDPTTAAVADANTSTTVGDREASPTVHENKLAQIPPEIRKQASKNRDDAFREYWAWQSQCKDASQDYSNLVELDKVFAGINSLKHLDVTYRNNNFHSESLQLSWITGAWWYGMESYACQNTAALLFALNSRPGNVKLKSFTHDYLPLSFFALDHRRLQNLSLSFKHLTVLHLAVPDDTMSFQPANRSEGPLKNAWGKSCQGIANVLLSAPNLVDLRFGLAGTRLNLVEHRPEHANWQHRGACRISDFYVPLWKVFGDHNWTKLRKLRIEGFVVCEDGLFDFVARSASTLKCLELKDIALWQGSFRSLFASLKSVLELDYFCPFGSFVSLHSGLIEENWRFLATTKPFDSWSPGFKELAVRYNGRLDSLVTLYSPSSAWENLMAYMTDQGQSNWPLSIDDAVSYNAIEDPQGDHSEHCKHCIQPKEEIDIDWDRRSKLSIPDWPPVLHLPEDRTVYS